MVRRTVLRSAFAFAAALLLSAAAQAQLFRAYLASDGSDANACILSAPCRLLPAALNAVADGGEIWMLDSANYNSATVTVGKSVSILAVPGAVGSVVAIGGPAISITASSLKVALRNLVIAPFPGGGGTNGVDMTGSSTLTIEHSLIANLPGSAVSVVGAGKLKIANTIIRNNALLAVRLENGVAAEISGTQMLANGSGGLWAIGSAATLTATTASVSDSVISGGNVAVYAFTSIAGADARITVTRTTIDGASYALTSETNGSGTAVVAVSNSMITNNLRAWSQTGAGSTIRTLLNNHITDNVNPSVGSLTATPLQ
jgi:hypothetical protein